MEAKLVIAGIDVHKRMPAVVVVDEDHPQQALEQRKFGTNDGELKHLAAWLVSHGVSLVVMESTALHLRPVWLVLEGSTCCIWCRHNPMWHREDGSGTTPTRCG
jgi:hypothetical protein